jgi:uncharacterized protein YrrD
VRLLVTASEIMGLPIVTVDGGEDLAEVRDVIYSPGEGSLAGLTLNKRGFLAGRLRAVLPAADIHAIGRHAVMVRDDTSLSSPDAAPEGVGNPDAKRNVVGDDVLTEGGVSLGTVRDLVLLVGSKGEVIGYQIDTTDGGKGFIPLPAQLSVSGSTLVVPDVTKDFVTQELVGLGASVDDFRARLGLS